MTRRALRRGAHGSAHRDRFKPAPALELLENRLVPTGGMSLNQNYVAQIYQDLLGRAADQQGIDYWSAQLDRGMTRGACAGQLIHSDEALTHRLDNLYEQYLGRAADDSGKSTFLPLLNSGKVEQVEASLLSSTEYASKNGIHNLADFLAHVYVDVLGRPADSGAQAYFADKIFANNSMAIATVVVSSPEAHEDVIHQDYLQFLEREPDATGAAFWKGAFSQGCDTLMLARAILGSDEYFLSPHANNDAVETTSGSAVTCSVAANDVRLFGRKSEVEIVQNPLNGFAAVREDGSVIYVPRAGFTGTDILTYRLHTDAGGSSSIGVLTVTINAAS
jgi:hypothetical protein